MAVIWGNGEWRSDGTIPIAADDRGLLLGMGAFETMLAINGVIQHWEKHHKRLQDAVARLGLCDLQAFDLPAIGRELCEKNVCENGRARLRLTATAGEGALAEKRPGSAAMVWLSAQALTPTPTSCKVVTLPWTRNQRSVLMGLKTISYAENLVALQWARAQGADEGIFFNNRDELCEACTANVFVRLDGEWRTPPLDSGCLPGVMREVILERNPNILEAVITREQLARAEALCLSSAIRGVVPVTNCDRREIQGIVPLL